MSSILTSIATAFDRFGSESRPQRILSIAIQSQRRERILLTLRAQGHETRAVGSDVEGLDEAGKQDWDLVLIEDALSGMWGWLALKVLRTLITGSILLLSATTDVDERIALYDAGADMVVRDEVSHGVLLARIAALLRRNPLGHAVPTVPPEVGSFKCGCDCNASCRRNRWHSQAGTVH